MVGRRPRGQRLYQLNEENANKNAEDTVIKPTGFYQVSAEERRSLTHYGK
jgi:hypothetical protein